ncbi:MAG: ABC transporter ATP-binding protein/permease, partial [Clostridia bacterium]|nr:ABC transporter ATP-binding protein/permease [Clostridia bacterium]
NGVITILGTLIFMLVLDFKLALIIALIAPISLIASFYIAKKSYKLFVAHVETEGEANGYLEEMISGSRVVKAFGFEDKSEKKFEEINQRYYKVCEKEEFISNIANPLTRVINSAVYCCVGLFGGLQIVAGRATVGLISSFLNYANSFGKPFNELAGEVTELQSAFAAATRIFEVLNATEEVSDNNLPVLKKAEGHVTAENVYFSYNDRVKLIENFNLTVKPGQRVAIVGPTGCGKTTLINLLMRFYDVNTGVIKVDETPITDVKRSSLRAQYGMVLQESWLYNATIRENIAYGKPNASMEEIIEAAKMAGAHEFIDRMPDKYETIVTEGGNNISQGQKQLLCIARIMLVKPPMLILDEATSNIDTRTELKIQQAFNTIMTGRTTFIVAHRLSTIVTADKILVMNKGNIIEQGTHDELIARHGFYYHLYNSQYAKPSDKPEAL